jgi:hypothetical protein
MRCTLKFVRGKIGVDGAAMGSSTIMLVMVAGATTRGADFSQGNDRRFKRQKAKMSATITQTFECVRQGSSWWQYTRSIVGAPHLTGLLWASCSGVLRT